MNKDSRNIIIFATSHLPLTGGAQVAVDEITQRVSDYNYTLFCPKLQKNLKSTEQLNATKVYRLGIGHNIDKFIFPLLAPFSALYHVGSNGLIWAIMANYGGLGALTYYWLTFKKNPLLLTLQEGATLDYIKKHSGIFYPLIRKLVKSATAIQSISTFLLDMAKEMGSTTDKTWIIPNGVDLAVFKPFPESEKERLLQLKLSYGFEVNDLILFTSSRLSEKNAIGPTIQALALLPENYKFLIAGDGELEQELKKLVENLNLSKRVLFLGKSSRETIVNCLGFSYLFIRPSIREGLGISFLEAMAMNIPVVASLAGGIKDFLIDRETGIVADPQNIKSIASAVIAYEDVTLYKKIMSNGYGLIHNKFNWNIVAKQMKEVFNSAA